MTSAESPELGFCSAIPEHSTRLGREQTEGSGGVSGSDAEGLVEQESLLVFRMPRTLAEPSTRDIPQHVTTGHPVCCSWCRVTIKRPVPCAPLGKTDRGVF